MIRLYNSAFYLVFQAGMWKWQIFVKAGSGERVPLPLWPLLSNVENLNVVQFFVKAEAAVALCKNKKIAILALTATLNLTQTLTLTLVPT